MRLGFYNDSLDISADNAVLALQHECVYFDRLNPRPLPRFIGTLNLYSTACLYIFNDVNALVIHVDKVTGLDLKANLALFSNLTNLRAIIIGLKEPRLRIILDALLQVSKELNVDIEIIAQKVLRHNEFQEKDFNWFLFGTLIQKANFLSQFLFGEPLSKEFLRKLSPHLFEYGPAPAGIDVGTPGPTPQLAAALSAISGILSQENATLIKGMLRSWSQAEFYHHLLGMFSREGATFFGMGYHIKQLTDEAAVCHLVFDVQTHQCYRIPIYTETPWSYLRQLKIWDKDHPGYKDYLVHSNEIFTPQLSSTMWQKMHRLLDSVDGKCVLLTPDTAAFERKTAIEFGADLRIFSTLKFILYTLAHSIKLQQAKPAEALPYVPTSQTVFFRLPNMAYIKKLEEVTQRLRVIQEITGLPFVAYLRKTPEHVVDAMCSAEAIEGKLLEIESLLAAKGIKYNFIEFEERNFLCIPAINCDNYAFSSPSLLQKA